MIVNKGKEAIALPNHFFFNKKILAKFSPKNRKKSLIYTRKTKKQNPKTSQFWGLLYL
jgi:tetraacyldisaccharide-1-P 4'-kinase